MSRKGVGSRLAFPSSSKFIIWIMPWRLTANRRFAEGMAVRLRFELPSVDQEIRVLGEVVRAVDFGENSHGFGIQFLNTDTQSRQRLEQFLEPWNARLGLA